MDRISFPVDRTFRVTAETYASLARDLSTFLRITGRKATITATPVRSKPGTTFYSLRLSFSDESDTTILAPKQPLRLAQRMVDRHIARIELSTGTTNEQIQNIFSVILSEDRCLPWEEDPNIRIITKQAAPTAVLAAQATTNEAPPQFVTSYHPALSGRQRPPKVEVFPIEAVNYHEMSAEGLLSAGKQLNKRAAQGGMIAREDATRWCTRAKESIDAFRFEVAHGWTQQLVPQYYLYKGLADLRGKIQSKMGETVEVLVVPQYRRGSLERLPKERIKRRPQTTSRPDNNHYAGKPMQTVNEACHEFTRLLDVSYPSGWKPKERRTFHQLQAWLRYLVGNRDSEDNFKKEYYGDCSGQEQLMQVFRDGFIKYFQRFTSL